MHDSHGHLTIGAGMYEWRILTSIDDFPEQVFAGQKVLGGTVPTTVTELMLAFLQRHIHAAADRLQHAWVFANQTSLFAA